MPLLTLTGVHLAYGHLPLLDGASLAIEPGTRTGVIGRNGTGKSSLLGVIAGRIRPDDGRVVGAPGLSIGEVTQEPVFTPGHTVYEAVSGGLGEVAALLVDYHAAAHALSESAADTEALLARLQELQATLEARDGWRLRNRVETVVRRLALPEDASLETLSGGTRKRVAIARALVTEPDLLLLDEPTNHLDVATIEWLESVLREFSGAVMVVTHDRRFLDAVATRIVELDRGRLREYPGNYAAYEQRKAEELAAETLANARFDKLLAQEEVWIRKGIEARRTRNEGRVRRLEQLRRERFARRDRLGVARLGLSAGERSGKMVAELEHVTKAFGDRILVSDFSAVVQRGDKLGLIGPNGSGKTTLIRMMLGQLAPDAGRVRQGTKVAAAYFDQFRAALDEDRSVLETVSPGSDYVEVAGARKHVMSYLGDFLFAPERARSPVRTLSGGERNRLLLARLFAQPANLLVLDEPTNDLDLDTLQLLEELLQDYAGTVILVSHDRAFLDNVVTQVIALDADGVWREYAGGYSDWLALRPPPPVAEKPAGKPFPPPERKREKSRLSWKETRELEQLPERISALESEQARISARLADGSVYVTAPEDAKSLVMRLAHIESDLDECLVRWETLETRQADGSPPSGAARDSD